MRLFLVFCNLLLFICALSGQAKYDYNWAFGYGYSPTSYDGFGVSILNFHDTVSFSNPLSEAYIFQSNNTISDSLGNLQFYTDGCDIYSWTHEVMENGEQINPGWGSVNSCEVPFSGGYRAAHQSILILPWPDSVDHYLMLHQPIKLVDWDDGDFDVVSVKLLGTLINMGTNNGAGSVVWKNQPLVEDTLYVGHLTANRHANGRDWWIPVGERNSNAYHTLLFTPEGIQDTFIQMIGDSTQRPGHATGQACFSPDGSQYFRYSFIDGIMHFDFDRQTGQMSNYRNYQVSIENGVVDGAAVSPNSQYLYVIRFDTLIQYDLLAPDVPVSKTIVGIYDGFLEDDFWATNFSNLQLGPDCRLYMGSSSTHEYLHVITNPDEPGAAANLIQRAIRMPTVIGASLPNFPNYRLGVDPTFPCDSTIVFVPHDPTSVWSPEPRPEWQVYPNPSTGPLHLRGQAARGDRLRLFDLRGRLLHEQELTPGQVNHEIQAGRLPRGTYLVQLLGDEGVWQVVRWIKL
jgi:hypothetical protein